MKRLISKKEISRIKAILICLVVILANFIQIWFLSIADVNIIDFRCDAERIGLHRYKTDVGTVVNFIYDAEDYFDAYVYMGDGTYKFNIEGSRFSYNYSMEGIYNITLWAVGPGGIGYDTEWLVLEVLNDAPAFDIGYTSVEYYEATYDFEDDEIGEKPNGLVVHNNDIDFYLDSGTSLYAGFTLSGGVNDLILNDLQTWNIQSELIGLDYRYIELDLNFNTWPGHNLTKGQYELYFSANETISLLGYNPKLGEDEILFSGTESNGNIITIYVPESLKLYVSFFVEGSSSINETIALDWFKLMKVDKGVEIVKDPYDHGKVVEMNFGTNYDYCAIQKLFSQRTTGTIEFWYKTTNTNLGAQMYLVSQNFGIVQKDNNWFVNNIAMSNPYYSDFPLPQNNTWYHIRIDWQGLGYRIYKVYINNFPSKVNFNMNYDEVGSFSIETNGTIFIDAIGFSWDTNYNIGQNMESIYPDHLYEDLEIKFSLINLIESPIDKKGFSYNSEEEVGKNFRYIWDFGDGNYSYEESPTHKFKDAGKYPVRLTLIDDQGAMSTKVKIFNIENKIPSSSIQYGLNYDVTYDFKYDLTGEPPSEFYTQGNIKVIDFKDEFSKVVEIDNTEGGYGMIRIRDPPLGLNGSMEFWIYFTDIQVDEFFFWTDKLPFSEENTLAIKNSTRFGFLDGHWMYYYSYKDSQNRVKYAYGIMNELDLPNNNEWTHVRFDYCCSDNIIYKGLSGNQWRIYVNGNTSNIYDAVGEIFNRKGFDIKISSHIYLESIGFTRDTNYYLGDNNPPRKQTYYGTWDFRFYPIGPIPYDETIKMNVLGPWIFGSYNLEKIANNCSVNIIPELDDHIKVLELQDNNNTDYVVASLFDFAESQYGTLEFWLRTTDTTQGLTMALGYEVFDSGIWLGAEGNWWYRQQNNTIPILDVPRMQNNTWHHIRIDFDCRKNGGYLGLEKGQFNFWVDEILSMTGPYNFDYNVKDFGWNIWSTQKQGKDYSIYLDAIGASWDPAYEVGDNLKPRESILTNFELILSADVVDTPTDNNNMRFFWNFGDNHTAFGQTVLHTYNRPGKYKIQLITLDDNAAYDSSEEFIWIDNLYPSINISKLTYGYATYDFFEDSIGSFPSGWFRSDLEESLGNITRVVELIDGFSNVVQIGDGSGVGGIWTYNCSGLPYSQTQTGNLDLTSGTIEFWLYTNNTSQSRIFISFFVDNNLDGIFIEFNNSEWKHGNNKIVFENLWNLENNTWTHFRIDFCCDDSSYMGLGNDEFVIYANDFMSQTLPMLHNNYLDISNLTCFGIFTDLKNNETAEVFIDNIGFSWDINYTIGDNKFAYPQYSFNEGETIILEALSYDSYLDYQQLYYNWGGLYLDISEDVDLGWVFSQIFTNDCKDSSIVSYVRDPLYMWDVDAYNITIKNVLPLFDITSAEIISNFSISIYNDNKEAANFSISLLSDNGFSKTLFLANYDANSTDNWINSSSTELSLDISRTWDLMVNQTGREGGEHFMILNFAYSNGYSQTKSYNFDGSNTIWTFNINEMWINQLTNLSYVPLTFGASINDPSNDKIDLSINYNIEAVYEVDYTTPIMRKTFYLQNDTKIIICNYTSFEENSKKYVSLKFIQAIPEIWETNLLSGVFPVSYNFNFSADMTNIDIYSIIDEIFSNESILNFEHTYTKHSINADYYEIKSLSEPQTFNLGFNISSNFTFENMAPNIKIYAPTSVTEDQVIQYIARVDDFNREDVTVKISFGLNDGNGLTYYNTKYLGDNCFGFNYSYSNAGKYLITVLARDGSRATKKIHLIEVLNRIPYAKIRTFQNSTKEDELITFDADFYDTPSDIKSLRYYWDFGDGVYSAERSPFHAYTKAGNYTVKLFLKDDNGASYYASYEISVIEQNPEIIGPFSFSGIEGNVIILDVDVIDSISDSLMNYEWEIYKANKMYNATFNFMDTDIGSRPSSPYFEYLDVPDVNYYVIEELGNHINVLKIDDNNNLLPGRWTLKYGDETSINGTIEFWLRSSFISNYQDNLGINLLQHGTNMIPIKIGDNGTWFYENYFTGNYTEIPNIPRLYSNNWHHIRIDYECTSGNYSGLGLNEWRIIIDGIRSPNLRMQFGGPPYENAQYLDSLQVLSGAASNISIYCDAIGYYNGLAMYNLGENLVPMTYGYDYESTIYGKRPSVNLNDGSYLVDLSVNNDLSVEAQISVQISSITPILTVPSRKYSGGKGYMEIEAYALDAYTDTSSLKFEWYINNKLKLTQIGFLSSKINIYCQDTKVIKGYVSVSDSSDLKSGIEFYVDAFIDRDGDGYSNEYEAVGANNTNDWDFDGLPNIYETVVTGTDPYDNDTDHDLLSDGWNVYGLSGERSIGTDPFKNDTDSDQLIDGLEWFGWNVTIFTKQGPNIFRYTSNPLKVDTDGDKLPDNEEFLYKTDPRNPDTDNDGLSDYIEIYKYKSDPNNPDTDDDGLTDFKEIEIGTLYNSTDTDGDSISDGSEYYGWGFITDPLKRDTDNDYLSDADEIINYVYEIDGRKNVNNPIRLTFEKRNVEKAAEATISLLLTYGESVPNKSISDIKLQIYKEDSELVFIDEIFPMNATERYISKTIDIKTITENSGKNYYGNYILKVLYQNESHADLCLEEFTINVVGYLDPNDNDYDNDGIWDGVETQLIVRGSDTLEYDNILNITADTDLNTTASYSIEISDIGILYDALINFAIISNKTLEGSGTVKVKVEQKELDFRVKNKIIFSNISTFSPFENFYQEYSVRPLNDYPYQFPGTYVILIDIFDNNENDVFNLINLNVEIDGYREAESTDNAAWITRPDLYDTDDDGWSDWYEIYGRSEMTNPLQADTDGDGVKDSEDIDPRYNIMIEIELESGHVEDMPRWYLISRNPPKLQITAEYDLHNEHIAFVTPHKECSSDVIKSSGLLWRIDYKSTATFENKYYIDVEDDMDKLTITVKLWDEGISDDLWDTIRVVDSYTHYFNNYKRGEYYETKAVGGRHSSKDWVKYRVTTVGYTHINTIAIFDNQSVFNGRYHNYERMNIIQVSVKDDPIPTSSFVKGQNAVVIPSSILINTKLGAILINNTALQNSVLAKGEFMSLDRYNLPETATNNIEAVFAIECSSTEAEEILSMTIMAIINETTQEWGIIYSYASSKLDNFPVELMNLHPDVIAVIAFLGPDNPNKDQGTMPMEDKEWWADLADKIVNAIVGIFTGDFTPLLELIGQIFRAIVAILEAVIWVVIDIALSIVEWVIRGLILAYAWIIFGIALALINVVMLRSLGFYSLVSLFTDTTVDYNGTTLSVTSEIPAFNFTMKYEMDYIYNEIFDVYLPAIYYYQDSPDFGCEFSFSHLHLDFNLTKYPTWLWNNDTIAFCELVSSMADTWGFCGIFFSIAGGASHILEADQGISLGVSIVGWLTSFGFFILDKFIKAEENTAVYLGTALGFFISAIVSILAEKFKVTATKFLTTNLLGQYKLKQPLELIDNISEWGGFGVELADQLQDIDSSPEYTCFFQLPIKIVTGISSLAIGAAVLGFWKSGPLLARLIFSLVYIGMGIYFLVKYVEESP